MRVTGVICVYRNSSIAEHGFGTGGSKLKHFARFLNGVKKMVEAAVLILVFYLCIGNRSHAGRTPVDHTVSAVNKSFIIKLDKNLFDSLAAAFIKSKTLFCPIAGRAELFKLFADSAAVGIIPFPRALQKALSAEVFLGNSLFTHRFNDLRFGSDRCVVGAGEPKRIVSRHSLITHKNILQGVIKRVSHMELTCDIGRGHYY